MQHNSGKGNLTAQNTRKPFGGRGSAPDPTEGAYSAPANPLVGGEERSRLFTSSWPGRILGLARTVLRLVGRAGPGRLNLFQDIGPIPRSVLTLLDDLTPMIVL